MFYAVWCGVVFSLLISPQKIRRVPNKTLKMMIENEVTSVIYQSQVTNNVVQAHEVLEASERMIQVKKDERKEGRS